MIEMRVTEHPVATGTTIYKVQIFNGDINNKEIHKWIVENISDYECLQHGSTYLFVDEAYVVALKLRWAQ